MNTTYNFKDHILSKTYGEAIEAIVIGPSTDESDYHENEVYNLGPKGVILAWEEASSWLDYDFQISFGRPYCHNIMAWTKSWILMTTEYDGAKSVDTFPRNPRELLRKDDYPSYFFESFLPKQNK